MKKIQMRPILSLFWIVLATGLLHFSLNSCTEDFIVESRTTNDNIVRNPIGGATEVSLANDGSALHSVIVSSGAMELTLAAAKDLARYLSRITGGEFSVEVGDGTEGIAVGTYKDFPQLGFEDLFNPDLITRQDEYLLRTHDNGMYMVGATDLAAQHAVWGFLNQVGYRQFFPMESWESIPKIPNLSVGVDVFEQPDFYERTAPREAPSSDLKLWFQWMDRNRMTSSMKIKNGMNTVRIMRDYKDVFEEHPEYLALVNGVRGGGDQKKFCYSNKDFRNLFIEDAKQRIKDDPSIFHIGMEPSDGGDWCECEECVKMGSCTDRLVIFCNEVAEAINQMGYGEKYVGILAYNMHSAPPTIDVHPKVVVKIATEFIRRGWTLGELLEGWSKHTEMIGIRGYHDVSRWSYNEPRKAAGGNIPHLVESTTTFYNHGARFVDSESSNAWGANGLGYYLSAPLMWNVDAVNRVDGIVEDFLEKCFRDAKEPMRKFYYMINEDHVTPRSDSDLLANMYEYLNEAWGLTENPVVLNRIGELAQYTHFLELWFNLRDFKGVKVKAGKNTDEYLIVAQNLFRHAYRMQPLMMLSLRALYKELERKGVYMPEEVRPKTGNRIDMVLVDMEPWQSSKLITSDEIEQFIADGIATYQKDNIEFEIASFSKNLEPAAQTLGLRKVNYGNMGNDNSFDHDHKLFTWFKPTNKQLRLLVTSGLLRRHDENIKFELFSPQEVTLEPVHVDENVPTDGEPHQIVFTSPYDGLHQLEWSDGGARTRLAWYEGQPMTVQATMENPLSLGRNFQLYFYVPKGTQVVGGHTSSRSLQMFDSNSNTVLDLRNIEGGEGYFNVHVPQGQDGTLWELKGTNLTLMLLTVPPYLARNGEELLLPKEIIESDKSK